MIKDRVLICIGTVLLASGIGCAGQPDTTDAANETVPALASPEPQTEASGIEKPKRVPPIRGEAELGYTTPVTHNTNTEIVTVIKVKNLSTTNSIVGLKVDEYWYDRDGNPVSGDQFRYRQPLLPEEVIEVTLRTPINPSMDRNQYQFEHANGSIKTTLVPSL